jgi:hypothetical protein
VKGEEQGRALRNSPVGYFSEGAGLQGGKRAQGTGLRAQDTGHRAKSVERRAKIVSSGTWH